MQKSKSQKKDHFTRVASGHKGLNYLLLSLLSGVFLSLPWLGGGGCWLLLAFVPLLWLQQELATRRQQTGKRSALFPYLLLTFLAWQLATTWWIANATFAGMVAAVLINTGLTTGSFLVYHYVWRRAKRGLAYTVLVSGWIFYEYIYLIGEISWPWLTLGNGFADSVKLVQWYEYTGTLGGSLWVLVCNILIYQCFQRCRVQGFRQIRSYLKPLFFVGFPLLFSLILYGNYRGEGGAGRLVQVIQPNIDPYTEKFEGGLTQQDQQSIIQTLATEAPRDVTYFVAPETAVDDYIWENELEENGTLCRFRLFLERQDPGAAFILGATTRRGYTPGESVPPTARYNPRGEYWYDTYNSAIQIDTSERVAVYHKSKLVIGVEKMPYPRLMHWLERYFVDLGGAYGQLGTQADREVFTGPDGTRVGVAICYESVYGAYFSEFARNGAQLIFVITNDGWWGETPGYRQHFSYARLRAIETRRAIARSANTGISGFISPRGDVLAATQWDVRTALTERLPLQQQITFYTLYGDYIGRLSGYVAVLALLYFLAYRFRKKDYLVD